MLGEDNYLRQVMNAYKQLDRSSVWFFLVTVGVAILPWFERSSSMSILLLAIHWVFDSRLLNKIRQLRRDPVGISFLAFFIIQLIWMFFSLEPSRGWHSIEVKLAFLILPILLSSESYANPEKLRFIFQVFVFSCLASFLVNLGISISIYSWSDTAQIFHRMNIGHTIWHPGIYSNYFLIGIFFMALDWIQNRNVPKTRKWTYGILIITFIIILVILISKTTMLALLFFLAYMLWIITAFIKHLALRSVSFVLILLCAGGLLYLTPPVQYRIHETELQSVKLPRNQINETNSTGSRKAVYSVSVGLLKKYGLAGCGTGSSFQVLNRELHRQGYTLLAQQGIQTHSQFLKTWLETGLLGILCLIGVFLLMTYRFLKHKNELGIWISALFVINILLDDILDSQSGSLVFLILLSLMLFHPKEEHATYH